ncbi:hypothetical protein ACFY2W_08435 [Streptomyces sp. NPDC001262]|uniref:Uncharacterized protein n=1 Tax=Streptomyces morookaense TaxID=1970 RepID=A0A7Y7BAH6_STRMO|nr:MULTISPECIES: hypothetical protein [Streptomyces]MCC2276672.1 hypothetical protein [Streptomyces sp. ET3-23]NVK81987.1 hypothetical protein [Streptomyces morookaense]GHF39608.1 hypothetical protein GCM10010359_48040 [Streptomyces morookaense]
MTTIAVETEFDLDLDLEVVPQEGTAFGPHTSVTITGTCMSCPVTVMYCH